jgi:hypothetical protein
MVFDEIFTYFFLRVNNLYLSLQPKTPFFFDEDVD